MFGRGEVNEALVTISLQHLMWFNSVLNPENSRVFELRV